ETDNSLSMGDEHLDTIPATESDEVIKSSVEDLVPIPSEFEDIPDTMCDVHLDNNPTPLEAKDHFEIVISSNDDNSSSDDDSLHEENIEYVEASPHDSELVSLEAAEIVIPKEEEIEDDNLREKLLNSSSTSPTSFLEETNTFHNSLPEFENFYFDLEEISSGNTTTHSDISLSDYEVFSFDDDHIEEISGGNTTTPSDISLSEYDSFIFDFANEEFADELAHIISPPEYDCFYFWNLPDPGELMFILNFEICENLSTTRVNLPVEDDHSPLLAYVSIFPLCYLFRNPFSSTTMGDENHIRTLGDYSKPSHVGYKNSIELLVRNNVVPLRSDTIRLVPNGCSFHGFRSEDPNQHLKDFLKLVDSLDLDGSITTWEDLTTRFLAQFFPPGRTAKLHNDILILVPPSSNTELVCTKEEDGDVMLIEIIPKDDNSRKEEPEAGEHEVE
nr:zinc finger, CCHC-type [Tanacetum cinerariifolium]